MFHPRVSSIVLRRTDLSNPLNLATTLSSLEDGDWSAVDLGQFATLTDAQAAVLIAGLTSAEKPSVRLQFVNASRAVRKKLLQMGVSNDNFAWNEDVDDMRSLAQSLMAVVLKNLITSDDGQVATAVQKGLAYLTKGTPVTTADMVPLLHDLRRLLGPEANVNHALRLFDRPYIDRVIKLLPADLKNSASIDAVLNKIYITETAVEVDLICFPELDDETFAVLAYGLGRALERNLTMRFFHVTPSVEERLRNHPMINEDNFVSCA